MAAAGTVFVFPGDPPLNASALAAALNVPVDTVAEQDNGFNVTPWPQTLEAAVTVSVGGKSYAVQTSQPPKSQPRPRLSVEKTAVLMVGAGGIGCELLKDIVFYGFRNIHIIDLDTIDGSNLNRQFLFAKEHVGLPKAVVAKDVISKQFPDANITAHHGNVKDAKYGQEFFRQFAIVLNGLDNMSARKHVNRMCMHVGIPLVESGTMGYNGQVQPIQKSVSECYDCYPKPADQKTFAVCTIHARPSTMVHCVHYAKEMYQRVFGDMIAGETDEMAFLDAVVKSGTAPTAADAVAMFNVMFEKKTLDLLALKSDWASSAPVPLRYDAAMAQTESSVEGVPSLRDIATLFVESVVACGARPRVPFSKDDDIAVGMVTAVANARAFVFHIAQQSQFDIKTIAGNIVPAIATTNAIIAAAVVGQALQILTDSAASTPGTATRFLHLRHNPQVRRRRVLVDGKRTTFQDYYTVHSHTPTAPNPQCIVCSSEKPELFVKLNVASHTVGSFVTHVATRALSMVAPTVDIGSNTLYEHEEFEDLMSRPLSQWVSLEKPTVVELSDFHQNTECHVHLQHDPSLPDATQVTVAGNVDALQAAGEKTSLPAAPATTAPIAVEDDDVHAYHPSKKYRRDTHGEAQAPGRTHSSDAILVDE